jgi:hypothetical protein
MVNFVQLLKVSFLNGIGGYKGSSNWYDDKNDDVMVLYRALPPEMISLWLTRAAELRCYDVKTKNLDEIEAFIDTHTHGADRCFIDPKYTLSHTARLSNRSRSCTLHVFFIFIFSVLFYFLNYVKLLNQVR